MLLFNPRLWFIRLTGAPSLVDPSEEEDSEGDGGQEPHRHCGDSTEQEEVQLERKLSLVFLLWLSVSEVGQVPVIGAVRGHKPW